MNCLSDLFISNVTELYTVSYEKKASDHITNRNFFGICFAKKGSVTYRHNEKSFLCNKNHAVIIPINANYSWNCESKSSFLIVNFLSTDTFNLNEFIEIPIENPSVYLNEISILESKYSMRNIIGNAEYLSSLYKLIAFLNKESLPNTQSPIKYILEFINSNYCDATINNNILAKHTNMSVSHFRSVFKKTYNTSPMNYIQNLRIEKAKSLLLYSSRSISSISEKCGFSNIYSFSRAFKTYVGISPSEFVRQNLNHSNL